MKVTEGVTGYWHYHLSADNSPFVALCGARVMGTEMPLRDWNVPFGDHFPKRPTFCKECDAIMKRKPQP